MTATTVGNKQRIVRINVDSTLDKFINQVREEYPLLSDSEALKIIISKGIKEIISSKYTKIQDILKKRNQNLQTIEDNELESKFLTSK